MLHLPQELTMNHVDTSDHVGKLYSNFDGSKMINFGTQFRQTGRKYNGMYGDRSGGGEGIEFSAQSDESGVISPPLWKTSPPKSPPTETTPLQSHTYNHHHYRLLSPTSRSQAIARGKEELMQMVKNMPETTYELSLKDLVEHSRIQGVGHTTVVEDTELGKNFNTNKAGGKKKKKTGKAILRSGSMDNGPFLLKMFIPIFLGRKKKKSLITGTCAKVSPRPIEGEKKYECFLTWLFVLPEQQENQKQGAEKQSVLIFEPSQESKSCIYSEEVK
ncbi:hypothetical protein IFM89_001716 [Coptis chinensis]|uniref:Uncharacterized protein n=1 Tax=Coptis chinensis TaxID=261450 RepID=A0A835LLW4_9MAGN|nr:hypothetical protein IFM89_001716 [Coptis chinensis]